MDGHGWKRTVLHPAISTSKRTQTHTQIHTELLMNDDGHNASTASSGH